MNIMVTFLLILVNEHQNAISAIGYLTYIFLYMSN
jgi:hypothetical protein